VRIVRLPRQRLERMRALVREAMVQGRSRRVDFAGVCARRPYAGTDELIALASEAAPYGGIYATQHALGGRRDGGRPR